MASVFSLSVPFNGQQYKALVNIQQQHCDLVCIVRYVDRELQRVFSGQSLVFSLLEGLKQPKTLQGRLAEDLVFNTTQAISRYLQVKECIGKEIASVTEEAKYMEYIYKKIYDEQCKVSHRR